LTVDAEKQGIAVAEAFIDAFNAQDHERLAQTRIAPHVRLAGGRFTTIDNADDFATGRRRGECRLAEEGWHHTVTTAMEVVHSDDQKVHLSMRNDRCREDGSVYLGFDTLWIATRMDGHWGIQFRSSYLEHERKR